MHYVTAQLGAAESLGSSSFVKGGKSFLRKVTNSPVV